MGQKYLDDTRIHRGSAPYFIDKMPNNFRHIGLIKLILPNAKIIDARRHPLACCFSGYKQQNPSGQEFSYGLEDIGQYYQDYMDLMKHWNTVLPDYILTVHHEAVVFDLETQVRRILDFATYLLMRLVSIFIAPSAAFARRVLSKLGNPSTNQA
jgi:hypothetical protein